MLNKAGEFILNLQEESNKKGGASYDYLSQGLVLGQFLVLIFISLEVLEVLLAFILFRFFDILKIFPANIVDKKYSNHYGVVFDDIIAAIQALIVIFIFKFAYGKFF